MAPAVSASPEASSSIRRLPGWVIIRSGLPIPMAMAGCRQSRTVLMWSIQQQLNGREGNGSMIGSTPQLRMTACFHPLIDANIPATASPVPVVKTGGMAQSKNLNAASPGTSGQCHQQNKWRFGEADPGDHTSTAIFKGNGEQVIASGSFGRLVLQAGPESSGRTSHDRSGTGNGQETFSG